MTWSYSLLPPNRKEAFESSRKTRSCGRKELFNSISLLRKTCSKLSSFLFVGDLQWFYYMGIYILHAFMEHRGWWLILQEYMTLSEFGDDVVFTNLVTVTVLRQMLKTFAMCYWDVLTQLGMLRNVTGPISRFLHSEARIQRASFSKCEQKCRKRQLPASVFPAEPISLIPQAPTHQADLITRTYLHMHFHGVGHHCFSSF